MVTTSVFLAGLGTAMVAHAIMIPLQRRQAPHNTTVQSNNTQTDPFGFVNTNNNIYTGTIHISGHPFSVQIDTGSSDLWVDTANVPLDGLVDTGGAAFVSYADNFLAEGNVNIAEVTWSNFTISQQAFINAPNSNATHGGLFQGVIGAGPGLRSAISGLLNGTQYNGATFFENIFNLSPDEPNFISFYLSRNVVGAVDGGDFTIGKIVPNFTHITEAPKLPVISTNRWLVTMDGMNVNGRNVTLKSNNNNPASTLRTVLDTGTSLVLAPEAIVDAMYGDIPGSSLDKASGRMVIPCDTKMNVSVTFAGIEYPIHPLDLLSPVSMSSDGRLMCEGAFVLTQPPDDADIILGDTFLRNVYSLYDFGNWVRAGDHPPFIQLLSTTDANKAWAEFDTMNEARILQILQEDTAHTTPSASVSLPSAPTSTSSSTDNITSLSGALSDQRSSPLDSSVLIRNSYIVMGFLGVTLLILLLFTVVLLVKRGAIRDKEYKKVNKFPDYSSKEAKPLSLSTAGGEAWE